MLSPRTTLAIVLAVLVSVATCAAATASARARTPARPPALHFRLLRYWTLPSIVAGEGVASYPDGQLLFRGAGEVPPAVRAMGYTHVGDEDIDPAGYIYDDYENDNPDPTAKLYTITAPDGTVSDYPHPLAPGEEFNNSFVTVSPNNRWMVSGEWNLESRLLLFANPKGLPSGTSIPLAGQIDLRPALNHVQGCDFYTARRLICDIDATPDFHPVVEVDLSARLHAGIHRHHPRAVRPARGERVPGDRL